MTVFLNEIGSFSHVLMSSSIVLIGGLKLKDIRSDSLGEISSPWHLVVLVKRGIGDGKAVRLQLCLESGITVDLDQLMEKFEISLVCSNFPLWEFLHNDFLNVCFPVLDVFISSLFLFSSCKMSMRLFSPVSLFSRFQRVMLVSCLESHLCP